MAIVIGSTSAGVLGTVNMGELKSMIQAQGYGTDTTAVQTTMIRFSLRFLYGLRRYKFLTQTNTSFSATVANDGIVPIGSIGRGLMVDSVRIWTGSDFRDMVHVQSTVELARERFVDRTLGFPRRWARYGDSIAVYPRPNATYSLEITEQALTTLPSDDGDTIVWPETHIDVLIYAVIIQLCRRQRDRQGELNAKQDLADALVQLYRDEENEDMQTDLEVGHWDGWRKGGVELP